MPVSKLVRKVGLKAVAAAAGLALIGAAGHANADIILTETAGPVAVAGGYSYTYDAVLSFNSELTPTSNFSSFGTLYDAGLTAPTISAKTGLLATAFDFTELPVNTAAFQTLPVDSAAYYNVRFTYNNPTGGVVVGGPFNVGSPGTTIGTAPLDLGTFTITSPFNTQVVVSYDGQSTASFGTIAGAEQGNVGSTLAPRGTVPEPASLGLIGLGIAGMAARRRRA